MVLFGNRIFTHVIRLRGGHIGLRWALLQYDWCPYERRKIWTQTQKEGDHMKTEVEIGVLMPQAEEHLELPEAERRILLSRRGFGGSMANT